MGFATYLDFARVAWMYTELYVSQPLNNRLDQFKIFEVHVRLKERLPLIDSNCQRWWNDHGNERSFLDKLKVWKGTKEEPTDPKSTNKELEYETF